MTLMQSFDLMTMPQQVLWFARCGCCPAEIAEWMQLPEREIEALIAWAHQEYEPLRRPA